MPNFTCDICGGAIKMQANKTGICQNCGMEYDIEAIKAMVGSSSKSPTSPTAVNTPKISTPAQPKQQEMDRDSLLIYLKDVCIIETIIYNDKKTKEQLDSKLLQIAVKVVNTQPPVFPGYYSKEIEELKRRNDDPDGIGFASMFEIILGIIGIIILLLAEGFFWKFLAIISIFCGFIGLIMGIRCFRIAKEKREKIQELEHWAKMEKEEWEKEEKTRTENINNLRKDQEKYASQLAEKINEVSSEVLFFKNLLERAYSENIVPVQFRTIEGVYYLYDYLSTSNQTLSEALMQANLEAIKQKLDSVLTLQAETLIQQAQTNAKLDKVVEYSEATMNNTALAAKYAAIAALNSEVTKKLQAEQLAYQKAEFWLK